MGANRTERTEKALGRMRGKKGRRGRRETQRKGLIKRGQSGRKRIKPEGGKGRKKKEDVPKRIGKEEESPKIDRKCTKYEIACRGGGVTLQQEKIITAMT